ncbi:MAG: phosphatase PAP2 family protein [Polyangiaceae bacterium]
MRSVLGGLALLVACSGTARADVDPAASDRPVELADGVVLGASAALALGLQAAPTVPSRWPAQGTLFDDAVRDALRPDSGAARRTAKTTSDVFAATAIAIPFAVDAMALTWFRRGDRSRAWTMVVTSLESLFVGLATQQGVAALASRERPYSPLCGTSSSPAESDCAVDSTYRYRSFFSGHATTAFVSAASTCADHLHYRLAADVIPPALVCANAFVLASATGVLRVVSDQHWASDVIAGAIVGTAIGFAVPYVTRFGNGGTSGPSARVVPTGTGLSLVGRF